MLSMRIIRVLVPTEKLFPSDRVIIPLSTLSIVPESRSAGFVAGEAAALATGDAAGDAAGVAAGVAAPAAADVAVGAGGVVGAGATVAVGGGGLAWAQPTAKIAAVVKAIVGIARRRVMADIIVALLIVALA